MSESVVKQMENSAFFDNVTWLNQENWQKYFGKSLPNGVLVDGALKLDATGYQLEGTLDVRYDANVITIGPGSVMANGMYTENQETVELQHVTQAQKTMFVCIRIDNDNSKSSIITKYDCLTEDEISIDSALRSLNTDESFLCTRNENIYEIPILFEYYGNGTHLLDLRRLVYAPSSKKRFLALDSNSESSFVKAGILRGYNFAQLYGGMTYAITIGASEMNPWFDIHPNFTSSNEPTRFIVVNESGETRKLRLRNVVNSFEINYEWRESWESDSLGPYISIANGSSIVIQLDIIKIGSSSVTFTILTKSLGSGGGVDPDSVYTKTEIDNMLDAKANADEVNSAIARKAESSSLGSLAYQNVVNYEMQITNKPVIGRLASKDTVNYETDISNKPMLGSLSGKDDAPSDDKIYFRKNADWVADSQPDIYVDVINGSDDGEGTAASPYETIQKAVDSINVINSSKPTTIILMSNSGAYYGGDVVISNKRVIIKRNDNIRSILNGTRSSLTSNTLRITDNSYVELIGDFLIRNSITPIYVNNNSVLIFNKRSNADTLTVETSPVSGTPSDSVTYTHIYVGGGSRFICNAPLICIGQARFGYGIHSTQSSIASIDSLSLQMVKHPYMENGGKVLINNGIDNIIYVNHPTYNSVDTIQKAIEMAPYGIPTTIKIQTLDNYSYNERIEISGKNITFESNGGRVSIEELSDTGVFPLINITNGANVKFYGDFKLSFKNSCILVSDCSTFVYDFNSANLHKLEVNAMNTDSATVGTSIRVSNCSKFYAKKIIYSDSKSSEASDKITAISSRYGSVIYIDSFTKNQSYSEEYDRSVLFESIGGVLFYGECNYSDPITKRLKGGLILTGDSN